MMLIYLRVSLLCAFILVFTNIQARTPLPKSLLYHGKPIDALCFAQNDGTISLPSCGIPLDPHLIKINEIKIKPEKEWFGYSFKVKNAGPTQGYSYYRAIAHVNDKDILFTINNGGGSGEFTALKTVVRKGNQLILHTLKAGDRCNGGLSHVKKNAHEISYDINITPFDLFTISHDNLHHIKAYDDLVACAVCCAGKMHVSRSLRSHFEKEQIKFIDLSSYSLDAGGYGDDKPYQLCFNSLINRYKSINKLIFTPQELSRFISEFNNKCVTSKRI